MISPMPLGGADNALRPTSFDTMVGQERLKPLLRRLVATAKRTGRPMDHLLMVGASGIGKTTVSMVVARELDTRIFALKAPLDMGTLDELRQCARTSDVVFVDEIHMQVSGDRRGITQACDPESFYQLLEDGVLATPSGMQSFPRVTWIGATTDIGLLPEALTNRFPLQPRLQAYTVGEIAILGSATAVRLGLPLGAGVADLFAAASRGNPRQVNSYIRSAAALAGGSVIDLETARETVEDLNSTTRDGLNESMQTALRYMLTSCRREVSGETVYQCSVNQLATACGHGRDTKAIALLVEPYLIQRGLLQVTPQGRRLTDAGVRRAAVLAGVQRTSDEPQVGADDQIGQLRELLARVDRARAQLAFIRAAA